jgi:hypothetical protein
MTRPLGWWGPVHREAVRRGLVADTEPVQNRSGAFIRRRWTAAEAEQWTREDWMVIVLSPFVLGGLMIGVVWSLLLIPVGYLVLTASVLGCFLIWWIIDPKLRAVSAEYEQQQAGYIDQNEALTLDKAEA